MSAPSQNQDQPLLSQTKCPSTPVLHSDVFPGLSYRLYDFNEIPKWQKDNDFILHGYVKETNSFAKCFQSLLYFNNEWMNIFTHLIPGSVMPLVLWLILMPFTAARNPNYIKLIPHALIDIPTFTDSSTADKVVFGLFFLGFISCLSMSAIFHTIKVHSYKVATFGNTLDYAGIVILISTSMVGIIYYAFSGSPVHQLIFLALTALFGSVSMVSIFNPNFKSVEWRPYRTAIFVSFGLSALLPIGYGIHLYGFNETESRCGFWYVLLEGVGYITGALLYALRIPERFHPGKFDIFGHSHQIFHICVVLSAFSHFKALVISYISAHQRSM